MLILAPTKGTRFVITNRNTGEVLIIESFMKGDKLQLGFEGSAYKIVREKFTPRSERP